MRNGNKKIRFPTDFAGLTHQHNSIVDGSLASYFSGKRASNLLQSFGNPLPIIYGTQLVCHKKWTGASNAQRAVMEHKLQ